MPIKYKANNHVREIGLTFHSLNRYVQLKRMQKLLLFILPILIFGCQNSDNLEDKPELTFSDSTATVQIIKDSLEAEMYSQWFMEPTHKKFHCFNPPDFNPELLIEINDSNEILINGKSSHKSLSELVVEFYTSNHNMNDSASNYSFYTVLTKNHIVSKLKELEKEIDSIKTVHKERTEMIDFKQNVINVWKEKLNMLSVLGVDKIYEPYYLAGIEFKYPENCKINEAVLDSILLGFYQIREIDSKKYFSESYTKIFWKAIHFDDSIAIQKIEAFKLLHPVRIIDYGKSRYSPEIVKVVSPLLSE